MISWGMLLSLSITIIADNDMQGGYILWLQVLFKLPWLEMGQCLLRFVNVKIAIAIFNSDIFASLFQFVPEELLPQGHSS